MVQRYHTERKLVETHHTRRLHHIIYHHCQLEQIKLVPCHPYVRCKEHFFLYFSKSCFLVSLFDFPSYVFSSWFLHDFIICIWVFHCDLDEFPPFLKKWSSLECFSKTFFHWATIFWCWNFNGNFCAQLVDVQPGKALIRKFYSFAWTAAKATKIIILKMQTRVDSMNACCDLWVISVTRKNIFKAILKRKMFSAETKKKVFDVLLYHNMFDVILWVSFLNVLICLMSTLSFPFLTLCIDTCPSCDC